MTAHIVSFQVTPASVSQSRARAALARVSAVLKLFDVMIKPVRCGSDRANTSPRSAGSIFDTNATSGPS